MTDIEKDKDLIAKLKLLLEDGSLTPDERRDIQDDINAVAMAHVSFEE